jgi:hypothetical protein
MAQLREAHQSLLQKSASEAGFEKVKKRIHELYDSEWIQRLEPIEPEPEPAKPAKIADAVPEKH